MASTELTRLREKARTDRAGLYRLLDAAILAHVGIADDNRGVVVIPTAVARDADSILVHGSTGSGWMRRAAGGGPVCVTVTELSGIVVARSAFESSFHYRSAVLFGTFTRLSGAALRRALDVLTEHFVPGRTAELRAPHNREVAATMVLRMPIREWSLKVSAGWPQDEPDDVAGDAWAGVIPLSAQQPGAPLTAPDLRPAIPVPPSVQALTARSYLDAV
jgi:nitroimidazol reductase NimA-like FMN-containing flavoprotein (pyridoxamine 5'-phosphate oxidase superfamily)